MSDFKERIEAAGFEVKVAPMPTNVKPDLKNRLDQIPFIGMKNEDFLKVATKLGYECEMLTEETGYVIKLQARGSKELVIMTEQGKVKRIY